MPSSWIILMGIGCLIIVALAAYAGSLLYRLRAQKVQLQRQQDEAVAARKERITESVQIIAAAMQREECELSEGTIRIVKLLNAIPSAEPVNWSETYLNLYAFYDKIKDMPILDARAALEKKARMQFDLDRFRFESEFSELVKGDVEQLVTFKC